MWGSVSHLLQMALNIFSCVLMGSRIVSFEAISVADSQQEIPSFFANTDWPWVLTGLLQSTESRDSFGVIVGVYIFNFIYLFRMIQYLSCS